MAKRFITPFAEAGDRATMPDVPVGTDSNYQTGYPPQYEEDPVVNPTTAKFVERDKSNQLYNDITANIKEWQEHVYPEFITSAVNGGVPFSYNKNSIVTLAGVDYVSIVDGNTDVPPSSKWAIHSALINDLSQTYNFPGGVAEYKAFINAFPVGKKIYLADRDANFIVISGIGTANTFDIIASDQVSQSITLIITPEFNIAEHYGVIGDDDGQGQAGSTDNTAAIQRAIIAAGVGGHTVFDGSKNYKHDDEIYVPKRSSIEGNWCRFIYMGLGTGLGQATSWAAGVKTGPVAGWTLGEEDGDLQFSIRFLHCKIHIKEKTATGVCAYGLRDSETNTINEGLFQPFDSTRTGIGLLIRGSATRSNFFNTYRADNNHNHEGIRVENYGAANTQPTGNIIYSGSNQGDGATDPTSIGVNFADSTVGSQSDGTKVFGTNLESCGVGMYFGALNTNMDVNARFEIAGGVGFKSLQYHPTATNIHVKGYGFNAAQISGSNFIDGFSDPGSTIEDGRGNIRRGGNNSSFAGFSAPINATNVQTHLFKENANTNWLTTDGAAGTGRYFSQPGNGSLGSGAFYRLHANSHATQGGDCDIGPSSGGGSFNITTGPGGAVRWEATGSAWLPGTDNAFNVGSAGKRTKEIFSAIGTINTSDENAKEQIDLIENKILDAWARVDFMQYKIKDSVKSKGKSARLHFGVIAQQVKAAFEAEGLDGFDYGILCFDKWGEILKYPDPLCDKDGNVICDRDGDAIDKGEPVIHLAAGEAYGIRYDEAMILEAALMRRELKLLKSK